MGFLSAGEWQICVAVKDRLTDAKFVRVGSMGSFPS